MSVIVDKVKDAINQKVNEFSNEFNIGDSHTNKYNELLKSNVNKLFSRNEGLDIKESTKNIFYKEVKEIEYKQRPETAQPSNLRHLSKNSKVDGNIHSNHRDLYELCL